MMELEDCAFPLLAGMEAHSDPNEAFKDTDYALLVGPVRAARAWSAPTCWLPTARSSRPGQGAQCRGQP
jgi:hypothetical protein